MSARSVLAAGPRSKRRNLRRRRIFTRAFPIVVLAAASFTAGAVLAAGPGASERAMVARYVRDWRRGDYAGMYALLTPASRRRLPERRFARELERDARLATVTALTPRRVRGPYGTTLRVPMLVSTRLWGTLHETLLVGVQGSGSAARIRMSGSLLFPGLRAGERLARRISLPPRAAILASDGTPLAEGPGRSSPIEDVASEIVGTLGPIPPDEAARYAAQGYPPKASVGLDGLEAIFQSRLAGQLGGTLLAGRRVLARVAPKPAAAVRTTIVPSLERAAIAALAGQYAGMTVMNPRTGGLEALAGIAFSALQPPGSTMKIITATAALQAKLVTLNSTFPVQTAATLDGYTLHNAGGEACGGTLINAFAVSCNSVFAPLGAQVGGARLVATAERYGFDQPTGIPGALESTIPSAAQIGDALAVGSSAIGQGLVQASTLEMADVGATIAMGGQRPIPTLLAGQRPRFVRVTSGRVAREVQQMMIAVVQYGTGTSAAIPGVTVAGKTGTAELRSTANPGTSIPKNTDAWFVGYAPVGQPKVVAAALFPNQGYGGAAAAPPVRSVIEAALSGG